MDELKCFHLYALIGKNKVYAYALYTYMIPITHINYRTWIYHEFCRQRKEYSPWFQTQIYLYEFLLLRAKSFRLVCGYNKRKYILNFPFHNIPRRVDFYLEVPVIGVLPPGLLPSNKQHICPEIASIIVRDLCGFDVVFPVYWLRAIRYTTSNGIYIRCCFFFGCGYIIILHCIHQFTGVCSEGLREQYLIALVLIMDWRRSGDKPLSEPMMVSLQTHICHSVSMS